VESEPADIDERYDNNGKGIEMKRFWKFIFVVLLVFAIGAQFIRPERTNPQSNAALSIRTDSTASPQLLATLERACFDCHSNETRWPWYSSITPVNFALVRDVEQGRSRMNFSEWKKLPTGKQRSKKEDIGEEVEKGGMPLKIYVLMHEQAKLSPEDITLITSWAAQGEER
jgi:hypothetical protein